MKSADKYVFLLEKLERSGFEAYIVGGCVRDRLLGRQVNDYDITTNALPEQIMSVFSELTVIPTGLKHGTVTVLYQHIPFEITTFRVDGCYSDSRRPDSVQFTASLTEDLARRDLTVNAMAMDRSGTLYDPFGGRNDLENKVIRCVGEPEKRFSEDALRILRTVRFASVLGFTTEDATARAAHEMRGLLDNISRERCREEICRMIMGESFAEAALRHRDIIAQVVPEFRPCFDFEQHNPYHKYDVFEHTVRAVAAAPYDRTIRTAMLFHDICKPQIFTVDSDGIGHFKGHAEVSADAAHRIMRRLRWDSASIRDVQAIIANHSIKIKNRTDVRRLVAKLGEESFFRLMEAKKADNLAKNEFVFAENEWFDECIAYARELIEKGECLTLRQLAVNGSDISALGAEGSRISDCLNELLSRVIDGELPNERERLLAHAREVLK